LHAGTEAFVEVEAGRSAGPTGRGATPDNDRGDEPKPSNGGAPTRSSPSVLWILLPSLLCIVVVLGIVYRTRVSVVDPEVRFDDEPIAGVKTARPRALTRATHSSISGKIRDLENGDPVPGVKIDLESGDVGRRIEIRIDAGGTFDSKPIDAGRWSFRASAPGYGTATANIQVPHRGEWHNVQIRLESHRTRGLKAYRQVALEVLPANHLWNIWTPHETLKNGKYRDLAPTALSDLTAMVERTSYGRETPSLGDAIEIEETSSAVLSEMGGPGGQPRPPR
jgi:hypothetical protein